MENINLILLLQIGIIFCGLGALIQADSQVLSLKELAVSTALWGASSLTILFLPSADMKSLPWMPFAGHFAWAVGFMFSGRLLAAWQMSGSTKKNLKSKGE